jgi:hypothetical protein
MAATAMVARRVGEKNPKAPPKQVHRLPCFLRHHIVISVVGFFWQKTCSG